MPPSSSGASSTILLCCLHLHSKYHLMHDTCHLLCLFFIICLFPMSLHPLQRHGSFLRCAESQTSGQCLAHSRHLIIVRRTNERTVWLVVYHSSSLLECQKTGSSPSRVLDISRLGIKQPFLWLDFSYAEPNKQSYSSATNLSKIAHNFWVSFYTDTGVM